MRWIISFLILISFAFSYCPNAPFDVVYGHNQALFPNLQDIYLQKMNTTNPTYENPIAFAGAELLSLFPAVDDRISADNTTNLTWVWAEEHEDEVWEEDSEDGCEDRITFSDFNLAGSIKFTFKNLTRTLGINESSELNISTPFSSEELNTTNGTDKLIVNISGEFVFFYIHDIRQCVGFPICGCATVEQEKIEFEKTFFDGLNYTVEGGSVLFFLNAPVLSEQWVANNHFDNIAFSKRLFLYDNITMNENAIASSCFYNFNISEDFLGMQGIISFMNYSAVNMSGAEYNTTIMLVPLEKENETFIYIYVFNTTYKAAGVNNLTLIVRDHFGNSFYKKSSIASRFLSFEGNKSEDGLIHGEDEMRKSSQSFDYALYLEPHSLVVLGILLICFLAFNRLIKK